VEASSGEVRLEETKGGGSEAGNMKEAGGKGEEKKAEERKDDRS